MKKIGLFILIGWFFCFGTSLFCQEQYSSEYRIGPKDLLEIRVFGLDELNSTVRVSEDGNITLPLLGEVEVEGLSAAELERKLKSLLEENWLRDAQVTIFILEYQSKKVSVLGAVREQGSYELLGRQTLLQIISQAGGLTPEAGNEIIVIRQQEDGNNAALKIPLEKLVLEGDVNLNIPLQPNDIINIPIDKLINIYVFGQVRNPGALELKKSNIPTLLQAIAQAGGFSERASKTGVLIKRKDETEKEKEIRINVKDIIKGKIDDVQLKENDIVFVPETVF